MRVLEADTVKKIHRFSFAEGFFRPSTSSRISLFLVGNGLDFNAMLVS